MHLVPPALAELSLLRVTPLAVVERPAHRRGRSPRNLDEGDVASVGIRPRLVAAHPPELCSVVADEPHRSVAELFVDAGRHATIPRHGATLPCSPQQRPFSM